MHIRTGRQLYISAGRHKINRPTALTGTAAARKSAEDG